MKTVTITLQVEDWVNWISQDADGEWHGFKVKPIYGERFWERGDINKIFLCQGIPTANWKETLKEVKA